MMRQRVNRAPPAAREADGIAHTKQPGGTMEDSAAWKDSRVLLGCLAFRLVNALLVQTYFNPDEHWQSAEVAHRIVFGYGHLTWEWTTGLRSYLHPLIFAALYKVLVMLKLDTRWLVMKAPRLLQAIFATFGDYYLFKLAKLHWGEHAARWALFCQMINWFTFFCMVRPFSNCLEAVLTVAALYYWPNGKINPVNTSSCPLTSRQLALFLAAVACAIRPTSAIVWLYVATYDLFQTDHKLQLLTEAFVIGGFVLGATCLLDRWMYVKWTFVPLNFLKFNFFSAGGDYYGTHPWHWYFSQGFPAMIFSCIPLLVAGIWWSKQWRLAGLIAWVLSLYSILGHKEFRFVLPVLPLAMMFAGYGLATMEPSCANQMSKSRTLQSDTSAKTSVHRISQEASVKHYSRNLLFLATVVGLLATNVPTALYMSLVHQRGSEAVMHYLSSEAVKGHVKSVMFLMPCHSTPFYSFLHVNVPMRFLDCSPSDQIGYVDEAYRFLSEPGIFLSQMFKDPRQLPTHFVLFDSLEDQVLSFFSRNGYKQEKKLFHSHFAVDRGRQGFVLIYSSNGT